MRHTRDIPRISSVWQMSWILRSAALLLVAVYLVPAAPAVAGTTSDAAFFGRWSNGAWAVQPQLSYSGMAPVQSAVQAGDYPLAKDRLLAYFRSRPAVQAGVFSDSGWPGVLELTPSHIWTLGKGETYLTTLRVGTAESTVTTDVTGAITGGATGFFLMSRVKDAVTAYFNSRSKGSGKPTLKLTLADGSVKTLTAAHDTYIQAGAAGTVFGAKYLMQVRDEGVGPFTGETRKAYLQFDLAGLGQVTKAELSLTGLADAAKDVMLFSNKETFDEATRMWSNTVQNTFSWQGDPGGFDWKLPAGADPEYLYQLPRFYFAGPLALAYQKTGDETHARTLIGLMTDLIKDVDPGTYPGDLHVARRVLNWVAAYEILRKSPSLTAADNAEILKALYSAGAYLKVKVSGTLNKMQSMKYALVHLGVYFRTEFQPAIAWRQDGVDFLAKQLDDSTYADGGYKEATDEYTRAYAAQYVDIAEFLKKHGIAFTATDKLRKLAHFIKDQTLPSGYGPAYGDSGTSDARSALRRLGSLLEDDELTYVGTSGASGTKPAQTSALYPNTRVAVTRSGWAAGDAYLRLGIDRGSHSHPDELAITAYAHGRQLLPDMGTLSYSGDARSEWQRRSTEAHSTIEIDNAAQDSTAAGEITHWVTNPAFDLIGAHTEGSAGARHSRSILSLRSGLWVVSDRLDPRDTEAHRYEQNWHFLPTANIALDAQSEATTTAFGSGANLAVVPADPGQLGSSVRPGYYSAKFYQVENTKYASYVKTLKGKAAFDTLLLPSAGQADRSAAVTRLPVGSLPPYYATALALTFGDGSKGTYYKSWTTQAARTFGSYAFDGKMLYVQTGAAGESIAMYNGMQVKRDGAVLVTSPSLVHDLAVEVGADGVVRIDGTGLVAGTDPAKTIGIAAPKATKVVLNGVAVPFQRVGDLIHAASGQ